MLLKLYIDIYAFGQIPKIEKMAAYFDNENEFSISSFEKKSSENTSK